jgi:hypothetical protein
MKEQVMVVPTTAVVRGVRGAILVVGGVCFGGGFDVMMQMQVRSWN